MLFVEIDDGLACVIGLCCLALLENGSRKSIRYNVH